LEGMPAARQRIRPGMTTIADALGGVLVGQVTAAVRSDWVTDCLAVSRSAPWVGLGRIVYVASCEQLSLWLAELGVPPPPVRTLPIQEVVSGLPVEDPVPGLAEAVHDLIRFHGPS
jgi:hypothetical protein